MKTLKFNGYETVITDKELSQEVFDIDFGDMMVRFTKQGNGFKPTNAMNGYGINCYKEIAGKKVTIE